MTLTLEVPQGLQAEKRERLAVTLYDARMVSQGRAAQVAGLSRAAFFGLLGRFGVTPYQYDSAETSWPTPNPPGCDTPAHQRSRLVAPCCGCFAYDWPSGSTFRPTVTWSKPA